MTDDMQLSLKLGQYQHYKGDYYQVLNVCRHSETLEEMVHYQSLHNPALYWVCPLEMFCQHVEYQNSSVPRFRYIDSIS